MSKFKVGEWYSRRDGAAKYRVVGHTSAGKLVLEDDKGYVRTRSGDGKAAYNTPNADLVLPKVIHKRAVVWYMTDMPAEMRTCLFESLELARANISQWKAYYRVLKIEEITFEEEQT